MAQERKGAKESSRRGRKGWRYQVGPKNVFSQVGGGGGEGCEGRGRRETGGGQEVGQRVGAPLCSQLPQFWPHPAHPLSGRGVGDGVLRAHGGS